MICKQCDKEFFDSHKDRKYCGLVCYGLFWRGKERYEMSDDTRKKMSIAQMGNTKGRGRKGIKHTKEVREKMSRIVAKQFAEGGRIPYWLNKKFSTEHKKKVREGHIGRVLTKETKEKIGSAERGEKHWNWKGGITKERIKIWHSDEYKEWRKSVFERDGFQCKMPNCLKQCDYLEANHIYLFSTYPELRFDINNGITLCRECHKSIRRKEENYIELFTGIVNHYGNYTIAK